MNQYPKPAEKQTRRPKSMVGFRIIHTGLAICLLLLPVSQARAQTFNSVDPSGGWKNMTGVLSLMLSGDALSFSYSAVFSAAAHICDGAGVAGLVGDGEYLYRDEQGSVLFRITENEVRMELASGIPSFCGANWPGEVYTRDGYEPMGHGRVVAPKSKLFVVMPSPPLERVGYLVAGDEVETVSPCHEGSDDYILVRFKGTKSTTVGMVLKDTMDLWE